MDRSADCGSDDAELDVTLAPPPWRRPTLVMAGLALLGVGAWVNSDRLGLKGEPAPAEPAPMVAKTKAEAPEDVTGLEGGTGHRHRGEEGKMGKPSNARSGLYAMKGPQDASLEGRHAGILGHVQQDSGHFLASPYGGAAAVGSDDEDVWGGLSGTEVGEAYGVGGLGLVGTGRGGGGTVFGGRGKRVPPRRAAILEATPAERYGHVEPNSFVVTADDPKSTFSIDVDTASYANTRRHILQDGMLPPADAVRTEELVNYFDYDYAMPDGDVPFAVTTEVAAAPWNPRNRLVHIGLQGETLDNGEVPPRNLVFLVDVSGSMMSGDKLPLLRHGLSELTKQLDENDWVSIVVYAGAAGAVLPPTRGDHKKKILTALGRLEAGGSTNGAAGIKLAYKLARKHFIDGGVNRVILATDGDFNVGTSSHNALVRLIQKKRKSGVFLSVIGVGTGNLNDHMMEQVADKGNGNYAYIDSTLEARKVFVDESSAMLDAIAKDVKIQVAFDPAQVKAHRLVGYENRVLAHRDFDDDTKDAGEIGAGHTVTALYEIVPTPSQTEDPLMQLHLRYKEPDESVSRKVSFEVRDEGESLAESSETYRFAAAVATFAQKLRGTAHESEASYRDVLELAMASVGDDPHCYRREFLDIVWRAGIVAGESMGQQPEGECTPGVPPPTQRRVDPQVDQPKQAEPPGQHAPRSAAPPQPSDDEAIAFVVEILRVLPPLLALPLFVLAARRPRRRRLDD